MKTVAELTALKEKSRILVALREGNDTIRVVVGMGTCGIAAGAKAVLDAFVEGVNTSDLYEHVLVRASGCAGNCEAEPEVVVYEDGKEPVTYVHMTAEKAARVVKEHLEGGKPVTEFTK